MWQSPTYEQWNTRCFTWNSYARENSSSVLLCCVKLISSVLCQVNFFCVVSSSFLLCCVKFSSSALCQVHFFCVVSSSFLLLYEVLLCCVNFISSLLCQVHFFCVAPSSFILCCVKFISSVLWRLVICGRIPIGRTWMRFTDFFWGLN
jgi:hypothetical protein